MTKLLAILFLGLCSCSIFAQNPQKVVDSKLEKVSVFLNGASVTRTAKTDLTVGRTELVFRNIAPNIDKQSIQVKGEGKFTVLSVVHQVNFLNEVAKRSEITKLEAQRDTIQERINRQQALFKVYKEEESMLLANKDIKGSAMVLKANDLKDAVDFVRNRLTENLSKQLDIQNLIKRHEADLRKINQQITPLQTATEQSTSEIILTISAKEATPANFNISYFVQNAGWAPTYDLRVQDIVSPILLGYKANVFQYSGEDWKNVRLTLSTANPKQGGTKPELKTWYLGVTNDYSSHFSQDIPVNEAVTEVRGRVTSADGGEALAGVSVILKGTSLGTSTDASGYYRISIPSDLTGKAKILSYSFIGMNHEERSVYANVIDVSMQEDSKQLSEVVVVGYGAPKKKEMTGAATVQRRVAGLDDAKSGSLSPEDLQEKEALTSLSFEILVPYTIPSDGKTYTVEIKEENIPALYEYACVPKVDLDVFLSAKIVGWEKYNLLEGETNLYFEGTFLGKSKLTPNRASDTLSFSLGRDKSVMVSRVKLKDFSKKQLLGGNRTEQRAYELTVRNTKKLPIYLVLEEQFPLSRMKEVEVFDKQAPEAELNEDTGKITWKLNIESARERKIGFRYAVKMPKESSFSTE